MTCRWTRRSPNCFSAASAWFFVAAVPGRRSGQLLEEPPGRAGGHQRQVDILFPDTSRGTGRRPARRPRCVCGVTMQAEKNSSSAERGVAAGALQRRVPGEDSRRTARASPPPADRLRRVSRGSCSPGDRTPPNAPLGRCASGATWCILDAELLDVASGFHVHGYPVSGCPDFRSRTSDLIAAAEQLEAVQPGGPGHRGSGRRQRVPLQRDADGLEGAGAAQLHLRTGPGPPLLEAPAGGPRRRVFQSAPGPRRAGPSATAISRGVAGAAVCARVRDRRDAAGSPSRASEHPEAAGRTRRRLQPWPADAAPDRRRHATEPSGSCCGPVSRPTRIFTSNFTPLEESNEISFIEQVKRELRKGCTTGL